MISWFDFLYLTFLVAILPVWGKYDYQNFLKNAAVTENDVLSAEYRRNILILFLMTAVIYLIWKFTGRSWSGLGFNLPNWNGAEWSGLLISGGLIVGTSINVFIALFIPEAAQKRLESYAELKPFFPHTATQHRWVC